MKNLGVSKDTQDWAKKGIKKGSDEAEAYAEIQRRDFTQWIPGVFNEKTTLNPINSTWRLTVATVWSTFIEWTVPNNTVVLLGRRNKLMMRLYTAGGALLTERNAVLALRFKRDTDALWKEVCQIGDLGTWLDLDWLAQLNADNKEAIVYDLSYPYLLAYEGEQIGLAIRLPSEVLPAAAHVDSKLFHPYFYMSRDKFDELKTKKLLRLPDNVRTGDIIE